MPQSCAWVDGIACDGLPVYFTHAYQSLFAEYDGVKAVCIRISDGKAEWYLPLLLRDLGGGVREGYTAYGYGGMWSASASHVSATLLEKLRNFLANEQVICAFIRHSPFLGNCEWLPYGETEYNRTTYVRALEQGGNLDVFCASVAQKLRWSVNYARRNNLEARFYPLATCEVGLIRDFYKIYAGLMDDKNTSNYYIFSEEFFLKHASQFGNDCELAVILDPVSGQMIAAAFFLLDGAGWVHYHLSASRRDDLKAQPVEPMMAEALVRYGNAGYKHIHLGGGHAPDGSDGLSRFKKKFSTEARPFHLSRWICDKTRYMAERARLPLKHPGLFLVGDARGMP